MTIEIHYQGNVIETIELPQVKRLKDVSLSARFVSKFPKEDLIEENEHIDDDEPVYAPYKRLARKDRIKLGVSLNGAIPRPVAMLDRNGNKLKVFKSVQEAATENLLSAPIIYQACTGRLQTYKNRVWKYEDEL